MRQNGQPTACLIAMCTIACLTPRVVGDSESAQVPSAEQLNRIDASLARAIDWLVGTQDPAGAFPTDASGQPGVTSLCLLALLAQGHLPGEGKYGVQLERGLQYVLESQKQNGLIARLAPDGPQVPHDTPHNIGRTSAYNHAISALMLSEIHAMVRGADVTRVEQAIEKALAVTLAEQRRRKPRDVDRGGWRYLHTYQGVDSDLSVVSWQLSFLRSAKNAGFEVPIQPIDDAVGYVRRCIIPATGQFHYEIGGRSNSRGMTGAGILALAHAGQHKSPEAQRAARWILSQPFAPYNVNQSPLEIYHYSVFYCCHAMYQMGGEFWEEFFPRTVDTLLANQNRDGSWDVERHPNDVRWGSAFTTALVVLGISAPNELLPIYQR